MKITNMLVFIISISKYCNTDFSDDDFHGSSSSDNDYNDDYEGNHFDKDGDDDDEGGGK